MGFFAAHSVASRLGRRPAPRSRPRRHPGLYLCLYYIGSSVAGTAGGVFYARGGWPQTVVFVAVLLTVALASAALAAADVTPVDLVICSIVRASWHPFAHGSDHGGKG